MIDAKDLRVGNWVDYEKTSHKVTGIKGHHIFSRWHKQSDDEDDYFDYQDNYEPIELTPEILEKAGFVSNDGEWFYGFEENFIIEKYETKFWLCGYNYTNRGIEYLHQLQNLYYSLTGEELPIHL